MLTNRVAFITGAANGIGRASAVEFAKRGAKVVVADVNDEAGLATIDLIKSNGGESIYLHTDVAESASVEASVNQTIETFGGLDIMFANAGIELQKYVVDTEEHEWDRVMNVNLKGVYMCARQALKHFIPCKSGNILITCSPHALMTYEEIGAYAASKGGVAALCRALALENAKYNVRVNCLLPGTIDTPMVQREIRDAAEPDKLKKMLNEMHPLGRMGRPEEVARCAAFLASDDASFVTGTCLAVDGGAMAKLA